MRRIHLLSFFLIFSFLLLLGSSCVTRNKMLYLDDRKHIAFEDTLSFENNSPSYILQSGDIIDVKVRSVDPTSVAIFNATDIRSNIQVNEGSVYLNGYIISDSGTVNIPIVGDIYLHGLTIDEANLAVNRALSDYFKVISVSVKLVSFRVTVLGEVKTPGTVIIYNSQNNIFQVLGEVNDITDYGKRTQVKIIRKLEDKNLVIKLDLSNPDIISSPYFYIQPNDVVYVEPLHAKPVKDNTATIGVILSSLTLAISLLALLISSNK